VDRIIPTIRRLCRGWHCRSLTSGLLGVMCSVTLLAVCPVQAADSEAVSRLVAEIALPRPEQDDAALHAIADTGAQLWVVGDQGAVWRSSDQGNSWEFLSLHQDLSACSFRSVCFLTDRVGWIAGGIVLPVRGAMQGVLLFTRDGGASWTVLSDPTLPYLQQVKFFDLQNGVAICAGSGKGSSGVLMTADGGQSWQEMSAGQSGNWQAGAFLSPQQGIVCGPYSTHATVQRGSLRRNGSQTRNLPTFQSVSLDAQGIAWLAGDGATLLRSQNFGVSWEPVQEQLPPQLEDYTSFHCVAHRGAQVWAAGSPGSVIWASTNGGNSWQPQATGDSIPLNALHFRDDQFGLAVGHLGRIAVTQDGGRHWKTVRGQGRRLACLVLPASENQAAFPLLAKWSHEEGYRSAVLVPAQRQADWNAETVMTEALRLSHAVQTVGGADGSIDWRLPLFQPFLANNRDRLLAEWSALTDRNLADVLVAAFAGELRTWRPSVIVIDQPDRQDSVAELIQLVLLRSIQQAGEPSYGLQQQQVAHLAPWTVQKVIRQCRQGTGGTIRIDPFEILPRRQQTIELTVAKARRQLQASDEGTLTVSGTEFVALSKTGSVDTADRLLFADLGLAPGGEARRALPVVRSVGSEELALQSGHRKRIAAATRQILNQPDRAGQLLSQMDDIVGPLNAEQAARQLSLLAQAAYDTGDWALAESLHAELVSRYPTQPDALESMIWLMQFWTSAEMNWQRLRTMQSTQTHHRLNPLGEGFNQEAFEKAIQTFRDQPTRTAAALNTPAVGAAAVDDTLPFSPITGDFESVMTASDTARDPHMAQLARWQASASAVAGSLRLAAPQLFQTPEIQFVTASLLRRKGSSARADEIYGQYLSMQADDPWNIAARGEAYLLRPGVESPKPVLNCKATRQPPVLDGILTDPCWTGSQEIRLGNERSDNYIGTVSAGSKSSVTPVPVVYLTYDDRFLYVAGSIPVNPALPADPPVQGHRAHDADLTQHDQLRLQIDIDRDYATYYEFAIDQRGLTRDACWNQTAYDPTWYCAVVRDREAWRLECAIPLEELLPAGRIVGTTWNVGVERIQPGIGTQSWSGSSGTRPVPALFGLIRFH